MKKTVLFLALLGALLIGGCYATLGARAEVESGYWHCFNGFCHWHEYGVMESYYVPYYRYHWYIAPPPPSVYITPRYYHYNRHYRPAPPHYHRYHRQRR
ncbi:hypothetical protein HYT45_01625 [Candidatus Uhrbacteria bacterium]|nr:hypothetical protein [Candidatus Uhrbacteria bacterium]